MASTSRTSGTSKEWSSAFTIQSRRGVFSYERMFVDFWAKAAVIAEMVGNPVEVLFQHSLEEGLFGVLIRITWPDKKITHVGHKSKDPFGALSRACNELYCITIGYPYEEPQPKKKPKARKVNGSGHERKDPAGKRGNGLRKRRRKEGR